MSEKTKQDTFSEWSFKQWNEFKKESSMLYMGTKRFSRKMINHDWKSDGRTVKSLYYVSKAIFFGASRDLPFKTLFLLGQLGSDERTAFHTKHLIKENVIKLEDKFYKLDDLEKQNKIRKALKKSKREDFEQFRQSA